LRQLLGREYDDQVQVTRCQPIVGPASIFHVAMEFFLDDAAVCGIASLCDSSSARQFAGWLHDDATTGDPSRRTRVAVRTEQNE